MKLWPYRYDDFTVLNAITPRTKICRHLLCFRLHKTKLHRLADTHSKTPCKVKQNISLFTASDSHSLLNICFCEKSVFFKLYQIKALYVKSPFDTPDITKFHDHLVRLYASFTSSVKQLLLNKSNVTEQSLQFL